MKLPHTLSRLTLAVMVAVAANGAHADEASSVNQLRDTTLKLIELLIDQGILSREKANALIQEAKSGGATASSAAAPAAAAPVRVPYVPEFVRKEIKEEVHNELVAQARREGWAGPGSVPDWVRFISWEGDVRVRYQHDGFADGNGPSISILGTNSSRALSYLNTTEDRDRLRVRARLGMMAKLDDNWSAGVRLATGSATDPLSANQTMGNYNNRYSVALDRAYARFRDGDLVSVTAGRMANPWFSTDLVFANDLSFDGIAARVSPDVYQGMRAFITAAALPVQEVELSKHDKWLFGTQIGLELPTKPGKISGKLGLGFYHYVNLTGQVSPAGTSLLEFTAPQFAQKGNTYYNISSDPTRPLLGLASEYRLLNATALVTIPLFKSDVVSFSADYVKNQGFDRAAVASRVGADVEPQTSGYQVKVSFGKPEIKRIGDWQVYAGYKRVERDAVLDAFTDSDFRLGGTDSRGHFVGGSFGVGKNTSVGLKLLSADAISGLPMSVDVWQLDLSTHF